MEDGLGFLFQTFYYSFGSGCIINIYVLCMLSVMGKAEFLRDNVYLFERVEFSPNVFILIFMFVALIIGIFVEGSTRAAILYYKKHRKEENNILLPMMKFILKPRVKDACKGYWKGLPKPQPESPYYEFKFMYNPKTREPYPENEVYQVMQTAALKIVKEAGNNVSKFRESYYIMHGMRFSSILILLCSLLAMLCVAISFIKNGCCDTTIPLLKFYMICSIIFLIFIKVTELIACGYADRYVRKVGEWYNALGLDKEAVEAAKADSHDTKGSTESEASGA